MLSLSSFRFESNCKERQRASECRRGENRAVFVCHWSESKYPEHLTLPCPFLRSLCPHPLHHAIHWQPVPTLFPTLLQDYTEQSHTIHKENIKHIGHSRRKPSLCTLTKGVNHRQKAIMGGKKRNAQHGQGSSVQCFRRHAKYSSSSLRHSWMCMSTPDVWERVVSQFGLAGCREQMELPVKTRHGGKQRKNACTLHLEQYQHQWRTSFYT